ncbi:LysR family transcriptional regulator [Marivita sp. S6314]|uniref:LysR family transcriptional regulator n=1 Tax=Marivita sp. S6314 TaxID=2926406 RepID=UPI001FF45D7B|nr:LysR family transcriptional regulator [Marivita sp. S6314]MCK0150625.1 LysR family transcriptional regulator [Marivita sp. S6314]
MNSLRRFDWSHIASFLATAETGSLSAAARKLGLTQPTLSRQVAALEDDLSVMLFERVGRSLRLTEAGAQLLEHARRMGDAADRIAIAASGQAQDIEGQVRITASDVMTAYVLPPALHRLREVAPKLHIDLVATNDIRDILRREADIAVRHVRPDQPDLIARLVQNARARFYGSTDYLNRRGRPKTLSDMEQHDFISFGDPAQMIAFLKERGLALRPENFRIGSANGLVAWGLAKDGFGLSVMFDEVGAATPGMEMVVPDATPVEFPIWLVTHRELHTSRRIRVVYDLLAEFLTNPKR